MNFTYINFSDLHVGRSAHLLLGQMARRRRTLQRARQGGLRTLMDLRRETMESDLPKMGYPFTFRGLNIFPCGKMSTCHSYSELQIF